MGLLRQALFCLRLFLSQLCGAALKKLMERQRRKERMLAVGHIPRPKGRTPKELVSEETKQHNELVKLRMQVELLRNFLSEAGRR